MKTKTQTLLANSPAFSRPNHMLSHFLPLPVAGGPEFKSIPCYLPDKPRLPHLLVLILHLALSARLSFALAQSALTHYFLSST